MSVYVTRISQHALRRYCQRVMHRHPTKTMRARAAYLLRGLLEQLPLDIALFHVAAPYPGTPFFFEVVREGWFRPGTRWEQVDMDKGTVLDYPGLPAERLLYWQKRAWREWAFRPGPIFTYIKMLLSDFSTLKTALSVGIQHLQWQSSRIEINE